MASWWSVNAGNLHYKYMDIYGIIGIFQEASLAWHNGYVYFIIISICVYVSGLCAVQARADFVDTYQDGV
jgi:hypothetical protein